MTQHSSGMWSTPLQCYVGLRICPGLSVVS
jgi:hypothetical protein